MSNTPPIPKFELTEETLARISGGDCSAQEIVQILYEAKEAYDALVDLTSYVIERVVTSVTSP
jgi:hypothetical protein